MPRLKLHSTLHLQLRGALLAQGHTLGSWARAHGYREGTVQRVVYRLHNQPGSRRRGDLTLAILRDLRRELGPEIVPHSR